jgi:hypothetical protein
MCGRSRSVSPIRRCRRQQRPGGGVVVTSVWASGISGAPVAAGEAGALSSRGSSRCGSTVPLTFSQPVAPAIAPREHSAFVSPQPAPVVPSTSGSTGRRAGNPLTSPGRSASAALSISCEGSSSRRSSPSSRSGRWSRRPNAANQPRRPPEAGRSLRRAPPHPATGPLQEIQSRSEGRAFGVAVRSPKLTNSSHW